MERSEAEAIRKDILDNYDPVTAAAMLGELFLNEPGFYDALHGQEIAPGIHIQNPGPDPAKTAAKLVARATSATAEYVDGMHNPRRDPKQAALRAEGKYENNTQQAIREKRYGAGIRAYDQAEAVAIATGDGGAAYSSGLQKRAAKIQRVHQKLMPLLGAVSQTIQNLPQDTEAQRENRMLQNLRAMRNVGKQLKGIAAG